MTAKYVFQAISAALLLLACTARATPTPEIILLYTPAPTSTAAPSLTLLVPIATPAAIQSPSSTELTMNLLSQSLVALSQLSSVRIQTTYNAAVSVAVPVAATVTPLSTVPITPRVPVSIRQEVPPFPGVLIAPDGPGPFPAVIVLHGSEGNLQYTKGIARRLAESDTVALALCYFGCPQTPTTLEDINLEVVMQAVDYLKSRGDVGPEAIALIGLSRGAELALIVGALDPDVRAVVSVMGSPWVSPGYPSGGTAWLYKGKPLAFSTIPVEQINGPVLLIHGERDVVWPASFSYLIADQLALHDHAYELAIYPNRGHNISSSPLDAVNRIVDFLRRTF